MNRSLNILIVLIMIGVAQSQLLSSFRFDYKNTTNQEFKDLVEFSVCGFNNSALNDFAAAIGQIYLNVRRPNWQNNVKMLFGENWKNSSMSYKGCQNTSQNITYFAIRQSQLKNIRRELMGSGFRQQASCVDEVMMRKFLSDGFGKVNNSRIEIGPKLIRMVFHDAMDFNNLVDINNNTFNGRTGVDYCLYSPIASFKRIRVGMNDIIVEKNVTDDDADPDHSRGLDPSMWFINNNRAILTPWAQAPDVLVLGSLVALEEWFKGPKVNFKFGRIRGSCRNVLCTEKSCENQTLFLRDSPKSHEWQNRNNLRIFSQLGISTKQAISLIGAHTIGGVNICTGFGNLKGGPFCKNQTQTLDDGTFFDQTPATFDNNYFKMLVNINFNNDVKNRFPECSFLDSIQRTSSLNIPFYQENICRGIEYCNSTNGRKSHLKNVQNVSTAENRTRRMVHLPSDWSNLLNNETKAIIENFANDQNDFHKTFAESYEKVFNLGYKDEELSQCSPVVCLASNDKRTFECLNESDDFLSFDINTISDCQIRDFSQRCSLVAGYGIKGQIQCGNQLFTCPLTENLRNALTITKFLEQSVQW